MSIKINYSNKLKNKLSKNLLLFVNEKLILKTSRSIFRNSEFVVYIRYIKNWGFKKKYLFFEVNSKKKLF